MEKMWNLWHGCHKKSEGCANCYVYRSDAKYDRDASKVVKTLSFDLPIRKNKNGSYVVKSGVKFWTCFSSDFFVEDADEWRVDAWKMMKERSDCNFFFITKRIERFGVSLPADWGTGYDNVTIFVTAENQKRVNERLPILNSLPIKHKGFVHEPLLEEIDISPYLNSGIEQVVVGGESGANARPFHFEWAKKIRFACVESGVDFYFKQTGANFYKDGVHYSIPRKFQHSQAVKSNLNFTRGNIKN